MLSQSIQDYLKNIYNLQKNGLASTSDISKAMNISNASVTGMLKKLSNLNLVEYHSYKGVRLTLAGENIALEVIRHHRILELFLKQVLGFPLDKVHEQACRLEHYINDEFLEKITAILGDPECCPHGHPIPSKEGQIKKSPDIPLSEIDIDQIVKIKTVDDKNPEFLVFFEENNLLPSNFIKVIDKASANGIMKISMFSDVSNSTANNNEITVSLDTAKNIFVENI